MRSGDVFLLVTDYGIPNYYFKNQTDFFELTSTPCKAATTRHGVTKKKKHKKTKVYRKSFKIYRQKVSVNFRIRAIQIIDQRKVFYGQRIPKSSCARKETVDIDIFISSRNE